MSEIVYYPVGNGVIVSQIKVGEYKILTRG